MLSGLVQAFSDDIAVDLGTTRTLVYVPGSGVILEEPSVVAVETRDNERRVIAVGEAAKAMRGRTSARVEVVQPLKDGVIADFVAAEEMLRHLIQKAKRRMRFRKPRVLVCVPASSTPVERRAIYASTLSAGARRAMLIEEPVAAALGAGLAIKEPKGSMVVDIGGGTTDIAILSYGDVLDSHSIRVAGNAMDDAIVKFIRRRHALAIGVGNAECIKIEVGSALVKTNGTRVDVRIRGRDMRRGLPTEIVLGPRDIAEALSGPVGDIAYAIQRSLEGMAPELAADICERGICLTGGGALLEKLDSEIARQIGVPVFVPAKPRMSVVDGCGMVLERLDEFANFVIEAG